MRNEMCGNCEKEARVIRGNYRFDEVGIPVLLKNVELVKCEDCGTIDPIIPDMNGLMHVIALAVICHPCKLSGAEIRFLRKYLAMSAETFSGLMDIDRTTLSKWENGQGVGSQSDRLIRLLVLTTSQELRQHIEEMLKRFPSITDCDAPHRLKLRVDPETREYEYA
jgi:DNA-binding transcriptional regulator YiaG